ncbi:MULTISPECIES: hypothetical protein [unclassified Streptomyces]|uniref:hypothetical protein n=1 Tax=unclassified Streptomyces TaxID=2593676 RepID=UPI0022522502|nr:MULTISPECIES: hypothetical protein [unclassified Streptomyces]MCX5328401.1 hypothetical protein [Streptomyces sp. NBC_00140]MCX5357816.1 hypothetical protein [Streptomyces sp. NBC_00124]
MTATVWYAPALEGQPSSPSPRMPSALTGSAPALPDGTSSTVVFDPQRTPVSAAWLMAGASAPLRMSPTGRLMDEAARLRTVSGIDRAVDAVWDAEGGREAPGPISRPRIPAVTALVLGVPAVALLTPHPAQGM